LRNYTDQSRVTINRLDMQIEDSQRYEISSRKTNERQEWPQRHKKKAKT